MPCFNFRTIRYYLPPSPLDVKPSTSTSSTADDHRQSVSPYWLFCLKCVGIVLLNGSCYITKYIQASNHNYNTFYIHSIANLQCFIAWGLFTSLWNIILSYNINVTNNKHKYNLIIGDSLSVSHYTNKIHDTKHSRCNLFKISHICTVVLIHDLIACIILQSTNPSYSLIPFTNYVCKHQFECDTITIIGFCYVFSFSSLTLMCFDMMFCSKVFKRITPKITAQRKTKKTSLSTPLVSMNCTDIMSDINREEVLPIQPSPFNQYLHESSLIWSTIPSIQQSMSTPMPSAFKKVSYIGDSNTIHDTCISIWCLNIFQTFLFMIYLCGLQLIGSWDKHSILWILLLLCYTSLWRYIMTRMGRMYDGLRIFSFSDRNSDLNTISCSNTQCFISMELILYVFVMSVYFVTFRIYFIYCEPSWWSFCIVLVFHIGTEVFENVVKITQFYYKFTYDLYLRWSKNDICWRSLIWICRDPVKLELWRDRFAVDIAAKTIVLLLSCLAAILMNITQYIVQYYTDNITYRQCVMSTIRVGVSIICDLVTYISMYCLWYHGRGSLFHPFTRIITTIYNKSIFVWTFAAAFVVAGVTYHH